MTDPDEDESTQSGAPATPTPPTGEVERLRAVERLLTSITLHAPDYMLHCDRAGVISYMNRPPPGYRMQDVIGTNVRRWMEPAFHDAFGAALQRVYETAALASYESVGSVTGRYYVNRISPVLVDGVVESAVLTTHDVTELKQAERERAEAEERYRTLAEASFEGLCISVVGEVIHANRAMEEMFGYGPGELVGVTAAQIATPESAVVILRHIQEGVEAPYEVTGVRKDGSTFPCELLGRNVKYEGKPARITGMRDLTEMRNEEAERARRESRVQHAQKLETLGVLAGGIAHDFNNLLAVVASNADLAMRGLGDSQQVKASLEQINAAVQRGSGLTHQLLVYAGEGDPRTETVDLGATLAELADLLRVSVSKKAELHYELAPDLPVVEVDPSQLHQLAMNLILNASEALLDGAGEIQIRTAAVEVDADSERARELHLSPGSYVAFEVADTGTGMDATTQLRIFDPFYTTKFAGRGLGLSAVQGIVRSHGGAIEVESTLGEGTRFRVLFPAKEGAPSARPEALQAHPAPRVTTVLVAEDEGPLARVLRVALTTAGHSVLAACDGNQALELFRENADEISVALLDVTMPGMDGFEVLAELRKIAPSLPVVLSSGYPSHGRDARVAEDGAVWFLAKPYPLDELQATVQRALESK